MLPRKFVENLQAVMAILVLAVETSARAQSRNTSNLNGMKFNIGLKLG